MTDTVVLLSGGMDSAAVVAFYLRLGDRVTGLFVDYGQPTRQQEASAARAVAVHYGIPLTDVACVASLPPQSGEIRGRNALLVSAALMFHPLESGIIAWGIHSGTPYYDCSRAFATDFQRIVDGYSNGRLALGQPFLSWTKPMVFEFAKESAAPLHLTWSCEVGPFRECGLCLSCLDRKDLLRSVGTPR